MNAATCHASHPPHQQGHDDWRCPVCGNRLLTDLPAPDAHPDCGRVHSDDILACKNPKCGFVAYGNAVAKLVATRGINLPCLACAATGANGACPRCGGRGYNPHTPSRRRKAAVA